MGPTSVGGLQQMRVKGPFQQLTYQIIGAAMTLHNNLGPGLKESVYHHALAVELRNAELGYEEERSVEILLDGEWIGLLYLDLAVEESVVVEVKALPHMLTNEELAQVITYLGATGHRAGVLINFGRRRREFRRVLPPRKLDAWPDRVRRYAWKPRKA